MVIDIQEFLNRRRARLILATTNKSVVAGSGRRQPPLTISTRTDASNADCVDERADYGSSSMCGLFAAATLI